MATKTAPTTDGKSTLETLFAMNDAILLSPCLGPAKPSGDTAADARTALAELDAIRAGASRAGASRDYSADAAAALVLMNARGERPTKTMAEVEAALAGGRKALADREVTRAAEVPVKSSFNAMVQREVEKLLGIKRPA